MKKRIVILGVAVALAAMLTGCGLLSEDPTSLPPTGTPTGTVTAEDTEFKPPVDNYIDSYYAQSVKFTDPYGKEYTGETGSEILELLLAMTKNAERSAYLSFAVDASKYYTAEFDGPEGSVTYRFYFSSDPYECYFRSGGGKFYYANPEGSEQFLNSQYSEAAYQKAVYPVLTIGGKTINPVNINWEYKKVNGEYGKPLLEPTLGGDEMVSSLLASFSPEFSVTPTKLTAKVTGSDGTVLYEGSFDKLCFMSLSGTKSVTITLKAEWEKSAERNFAGTAEYSFKTTLRPAEAFSINKTSVMPGDIIILTCTNSRVDPSKITVSSNIKEIIYDVKFFPVESGYRALIPVPLDTNRQNVTYYVTVNGQKFTFNVIVTPRSVTAKKISRVSEDMLQSVGVVANPYPQIFAQIKDEIFANSDFKKLYTYDNYQWAYKATLRSSYSDYIIYTEDSTETSYRAYDYAYVGNIYDKVTAVAAGKVVYVGKTDYTDGLVVVDHGMGLLSWYWNLSEQNIKVKVGDEIKLGDEIGTNGGGGLTEVYNGTNISVHVALTVYDVPVDLGRLINN